MAAASSGTAHFRQIDAKLFGQFVQDTTTDEGHDDHEEDLIGVALCVSPNLAQKVLELSIQVLNVAVARRPLVT